ncbi:ammonia channel protein [Asticcacaulis sp. AC460]|uniref:ammonium transporter n=1 Tax=Asticcacaulis sp. AC460 TaxID=1282360 RepID=UPI0003C3D658|nr:ammonium transporter [Asticcacaulis sp. AC460]ESQ93118.1 ammonia channel protein [Asticcacaulis sp. AC460]
MTAATVSSVAAAAPAPEAASSVSASAEAFTGLAHQVKLELSSGDTAFMILSTVLVLFMTLPGLALFYGGMVRKKNLLSTLAQSVAVSAIVTVLWILVGYSLAFGKGPNDGWNAVLGSFDAALLKGVTLNTAHSLTKALPEYLWIAYQMTFAIITPALIAGSIAERMKFSAFILFTALWSLLVYVPICHWVWGGGFLGGYGVLDFAGGAVVHVNSGVAGLVAALVLGKRKGFGRDNMAPHNLGYTMIGASMLLVGWIGFNAGSWWAADGVAAVAMLNTIVAAMTGVIGWTVPEWIERKQPTLLGLVSGLVVGLVAITPAAGFVNPTGALAIGLIAGPICYIASTYVKNMFKYDDSLDAFGVHGVGGFVGAILTAVFADPSINALGKDASVLKQFVGLVAVIGWSAVLTFVILMVCKYTTGLRVTDEEEIEGLDMSQHGETLHG